jgi:hypothetical protein
VPSTNKLAPTGLTETQARTLADWWGGRCREIISRQNARETRYVVIFESPGQKYPARTGPHAIVVTSLEGAQALEGLRDAVNPGAPDWVG